MSKNHWDKEVFTWYSSYKINDAKINKKFEEWIQGVKVMSKEMQNILYGKSKGSTNKDTKISRGSLSSMEILQTNALKNIMKIATSTRKFGLKAKDIQYEKELSDKLEDFFGKEKYMEIFFSESEISSYKSAKERYKTIEESDNPNVIKLQDELNPERLYQALKYKLRIKYFTEKGVRKMLESPHITKKDKKFLAFNLDQVQDGNRLEINYKEMIFNNFLKDDDGE